MGTLPEKVESFRRAIRRQLEGEEYDVIHLRSAWGGRARRSPAATGRLVYEIARSPEGEPRAADAALSARRWPPRSSCCLDRADLILAPTETRARRPDHARARRACRGGAARRRHRSVRLGAGRRRRPHAARPVRRPHRRRARPAHPHARAADRAAAPPGEAGAGRRGRRRLRAALDEAIADGRARGDDVERLGAIDHDDMPRVIAQATVCVAPAAPDSERPLATFPTKLLEYMACRRAVVAPRRVGGAGGDHRRAGRPAVRARRRDGSGAKSSARLLDDAPCASAIAEARLRSRARAPSRLGRAPPPARGLRAPAAAVAVGAAGAGGVAASTPCRRAPTPRPRGGRCPRRCRSTAAPPARSRARSTSATAPSSDSRGRRRDRHRDRGAAAGRRRLLRDALEEAFRTTTIADTGQFVAV